MAVANTPRGDGTGKRLRALGILLVMGLAWGLSFSLARVAAGGGMHPFSITFWEALGAGTTLLIICLLRRRRIPLGRQLLLLYAASAALGMVVPNAIFFYAASHVPAGILSISLAVVPLITFVVSAVLRLERLAFGRVLGVILGIVAIVLLVGPQESLPDPAQLPWVLLCVGAAACYASFNIMVSLWKPRGAASFTTTTALFATAALLLVPVMSATGSFAAPAWPWTAVEWSLLGLGLINAIAFTLFVYLIDTAGPVFTSQTANLVTLFGVLWGIVIFGERNSAWVWLSLATMMLAIALVTPRRAQAVA
ncbi:MAG TPA: DMT family transporter [Alphaproteobacteria bacterium]|nr:DMT family transporter [Alphaproteobacteria bacterium]